MTLELSGERSALAAQAHGRTVVNLFYEDSPAEDLFDFYQRLTKAVHSFDVETRAT